MKLRGGVVDRAGRVILPAGASLGDRELSALEVWGIASVDVESEEGAAPVESAARSLLPQEEEEIRALFRHVNLDDRFLSHLLDRCLERAANRAQQG